MCQSNGFNYIITGTSGTGKTTLLNSLRKSGYRVYEEPVRKILSHQLEIDGPALPAKNATLFVKELVTQFREALEDANTWNEIAFFDRGLPDAIIYASRFGADSEEIELIANEVRYNQQVFFLPPWKGIFKNDEYRKASFEQYNEYNELSRRAYSRLGYQLVDVPKVSADARVEFIESHLDISGT